VGLINMYFDNMSVSTMRAREKALGQS